MSTQNNLVITENDEQKNKSMVIEISTRVIIAFIFFVFGYGYCMVVMSEPIK